LPLLRAANNGLSGLIEPMGNIIGGLALNAVAKSDVTIKLSRSDTFYAQHGTMIPLGLIVLFTTLGIVMMLLDQFVARRRRA
jgi:apolipoprotein N-acyltransferase